MMWDLCCSVYWAVHLHDEEIEEANYTEGTFDNSFHYYSHTADLF